MTREHERICALVGDVDPEQLRFVEAYVGEDMAVFIPSVGPCFYAVTPDHMHPAYSFILNFDAGSRIAAGDRVIVPEVGSLLAMDPDTPHHELIVDQHCRYIAIFIARNYFEAELKAYPDVDWLPFDFRSFRPAPELLNLVKDFIAEADNHLQGRQRVLAACGLRICHSLIRSLQQLPSSVPESCERLEIHRVIEYMHTHFDRKLTVDDLASVAALSPSHFSRIFKRETDRSPMDYLIHLRLQKVKKLLRSGHVRITEAALQCGFSSSSHLADCFRKAFGLSPSGYLKTLPGKE